MSRLTSILALAAALAGCVARPEGPAPSVEAAAPRLPRLSDARWIDNFSLLDDGHEYHQLYEYDWARAVVLIGFDPESETVRSDAAHVAELQERFGDDVRFLYVAADPRDRAHRLRGWKEERGVETPILRDTDELVVPLLDLARAGEAILVDTQHWQERYRGRVRSEGRDNLREAVLDLLDGRTPDPRATEPVGEPLARRAPEPVPDYAATIAPILAERCVPCHRDEGIAPFSMSSHARVRGWSPMIREAVLTKRMPPWFADPEVGEFANDCSLSKRELRRLVAWIDAGSPRGEGLDPLPELSRETPDEWVLGEPDLVVDTTEVPIPSSGFLPYLWWEAELDNEEDLWVRAVQVKPRNRAILHHAQVYVVYPDELAHEQPELGASNAFAWYVPGTDSLEFPEGSGKRIPPGALLRFQLHYTTTGKVEFDHPLLGLYLYDEPPPLEYRATGPVGWHIQIPAGAHADVERASYTFEEDSLLYEMSPHMHYRGRSMTFRAKYPDGSAELLLRVPRYDFNWQLLYILEEPKLMPAGTVVHCRAVYDNSTRNDANPAPKAPVRWGLQSWDEMMIGTLNVHPVAPREGVELGTP